MDKHQQLYKCNNRVSGGTMNNTTNRIHVRGYLPDTTSSDLVKYFSQFGSIVWWNFNQKYAQLSYAENKSLEKVMNKRRHFFHGGRLIVTYCHEKLQVPSAEETFEEFRQTVTSVLEESYSFDEEVQAVVNLVESGHREYYTKCNQAYKDLHQVLVRKYPHVQVHPFGSCITGLIFSTSDLDIYLSGIKRQSENIDGGAVLFHIRRLLLDSNLFANVFVIKTAKVPIIKCVHSATKVQCDINIENQLGVCNSKLIQYYVGLNRRTQQAMIVLKMWGKFHKITGTNSTLSSYSLIMMYVFFLQQTYDFPNVLSLQRQQDAAIISAGWNGGFEPDPHFVAEKLNDKTVLDVLADFFAFYSEFAFNASIICPYLGKPLPRDFFDEPEVLPQYFPRYASNERLNDGLWTTSCVCLQDPFEHAKNTTRTMTETTLEKLRFYGRWAKAICRDGNGRVLHRLLMEAPPDLKKPPVVNVADDRMTVTVRRSARVLDYLREDTDEEWFEVVLKFTTVILKDFLLFELTEPIYDEDRSSHCASFTGAVKTTSWLGRTNIMKELDLNKANATVVEKEMAVARILSDHSSQLSDDVVTCKVTLAMNEEDKGVLIDFQKVTSYKKTFKSFVSFLASRVPLWFESYEKDLIKSKQPVRNT